MTQHTPPAYVVGIDFGTLSGRAVVVRVSDGAELGSAVHDYPHAVLTETLPDGTPLGHDWALQVPADYIEVLRNAVPAALRAAQVDPAQVIGVGTDFTACTMVPTTADGTPLNELDRFASSPHAYIKLWKHHAAQPQADRINALAAKRGESWLPRYGGLISSEWEFAKALQVLEEDPEVYAATERWVEAADWIIWQLTGDYVRNACTAGYKGIRQDGAYPSREFLTELNPDFADFVDTKLDQPIGQLGEAAGRLGARAAEWTGLPEGIAVAVGNVDAHVTSAAAQALDPGQMVAVMGTSTCHMVNHDEVKVVPGMCGVVDGGIVAGLFGYEAGQSGVGDIFAHVVPPGYTHEQLTDLARGQKPGEHGLLVLDWHGGNRSVLVNAELSGLVVGETLATKPEDVYRAVIEATAFGTRVIVETFQQAGVEVREFVAAGGLIKNPLVMQIYADVLKMPLSVIGSDQGPALGSAIHAAAAAGAYPDVRAAAAAMGRKQDAVWSPDPAAGAVYDELYAEYVRLHDYFGRGENSVMRKLRAIQRKVVTS
ncbi:ribulokinase [Actinoplanes sp. NPDC051470]|uniref:ribulokinase n=1 Tax=Actinoplanes sp. NPDC051470 TaxID=3157224 RepID=UPI00342A34F0